MIAGVSCGDGERTGSRELMGAFLEDSSWGDWAAPCMGWGNPGMQKAISPSLVDTSVPWVLRLLVVEPALEVGGVAWRQGRRSVGGMDPK